jgi:hypothetical protein
MADSNALRRAIRSSHRGWWFVLVGVVLLGGLLAAGILLQSTRGGTEAQTSAASAWPPFSVTYTVRNIDPVTGELMIDQTWRAEVQDAYTWRTELVRDSINVNQVGSYRELKDGVLVEYNANYKTTERRDVGRGTVVPITEELSPVTLQALERGGGPVVGAGWTRAAAASAPGRIAFEQRATTPCVPEPTPIASPVPTPTYPPPPGITRPKVLPRGPLVCTAGAQAVPVERRVEFDERNTRPTYDRGIAVFGEKRINGVPVYTFTVDTLDIRWPAQTATPDVPRGPLATPPAP